MDARNDSPAARPPAARHAGHAGRPEPSILKAIAWMTVALFAFTLIFMWLMGLTARLSNLFNRREAEELSA